MSVERADVGRESTFDWEGVRQRLATINATLAGLGEPEPETVEQILAQRAAQLAQPPAREEEGEPIRLMLVRLGREIYGLDVRHAMEVRPLEQITRVPRVPQWVAGVINLRGRIFSVLDLRRFFDLPQAEKDDGTVHAEDTRCLVIVETPDMESALLVDEVLSVEAVPAGRLQGAGDALGGLPAEYVRGVVTREDTAQIVVVLNLPALLADERLIVQEIM